MIRFKLWTKLLADMFGSKMLEQLFWILMNGIEYHLHDFGFDARKLVFGVFNNKGADQPAHLRRLMSTFFIHL